MRSAPSSCAVTRHVFGDPDDRDSSARLTTAGEVRGRWEELKAGERADAGRSGGLLGGVPTTLPSLLRAFEIGSRVSSVGFDWPSGADVVEKIEEEVAELRQAVEDGTAGHQEEEMGDLLFSNRPTCRASSASSPRRRSGKRTGNSANGSMHSSDA